MAVNKLQKKWSGKILDLCALSTGFVAVVFLLMLTRESLAYYGGQEVLFGLVPAFCLGGLAYGVRYIKKYIQKDTLSLLIVSYLCSIPTLLFSVIITRSLPFLIRQPAGTDLPFYWALCGLILAVLPLNIILGTQIPLLNQLYIGKNKKEHPVKTAQAFKYHLAGGLSGALLYTVIGASMLTSFTVIAIMTLMVWGCLAALVGILIPAEDPQHRKFWGTLALIALFLFTLLLFSPVSGSLEKWTLKKVWRDTQLMRTFSTSHGKLSFTLAEHELTVYNNRTRVYTTSENARIEENAHIPALSCAIPPRTMLMIGGGLGGTLEELLKYSALETIDYCEFDRKLLSHSRDYLLQYNYFRDKRVQLRAQDGRTFLRKTGERYDLILVNASPLDTLMMNRYTTRGFFMIAREKLTTSGIMVITLPSEGPVSGNTLSPGMRIIANGFKKEFPNAVLIPGTDMYCIGSAVSTDSLAYLDGNMFANRLIERSIHAGFFTPETAPTLLSADKILSAQALFTDTGHMDNNSPKAYAAALYSWLIPVVLPRVPVVQKSIPLMVSLMIIFLLLFILLRNSKKDVSQRTSLQFTLHGLTLGGLVTTILYLFQEMTGMAYIGIAVICTALLAGILFGAQRTEKALHIYKRTRSMLPAVILIYLLGTSTCLLFISSILPMISPWVYVLFIPLLTICAGYPIGRSAAVLTTYAAEQARDPAPGLTASAHYRDMLCGAAAAIIMTSVVLIPVVGIQGTLFLTCGSILVTALISYS